MVPAMSLKSTAADRREHRRLMRSERDDHLAEARHRITNNLQLVLALIAKERASSNDPEVHAALKRLEVRVQDLTTREPAEEVEIGH